MEKDRGFILPVALILLFIALSAGVVASKLAMQQSQTTGSALDSFVSLNYAKDVLNRCERFVLSDDDLTGTGWRQREQLQVDYRVVLGLPNITPGPGINPAAGLPAASQLWQTWTQGVIGRNTNNAAFQAAFDSNLFRPFPLNTSNANFQAIMPAATAGGACLIEPLTNDRFILTARAMTLSTFDMVQLQSFIDFRSATPN
jgi:hypothetical protein